MRKPSVLGTGVLCGALGLAPACSDDGASSSTSVTSGTLGTGAGGTGTQGAQVGTTNPSTQNGSVGSGVTGTSGTTASTAGSGSGSSGVSVTSGALSTSAGSSGGGGAPTTATARRSRALPVPGGTLLMGRSLSGNDACPLGITCQASELPEHEVTIEPFRLDETEVSAADFREFAAAFLGEPPPLGAGAHPLVPGSGWSPVDSASLPDSRESLEAALACHADASYTSEPGDKDTLPINCVTWHEAQAFCVWSGGRLPSEAEWEFAAAGGDDNRLYPWGDAAPTPETAAVAPSVLLPVGEAAAGRGRYGQTDLAGNLWEWTLDWFDPTRYERALDCPGCLPSAEGTHRGLRGGAYTFEPSAARAAVRSGDLPGARKRALGFRCAYQD